MNSNHNLKLFSRYLPLFLSVVFLVVGGIVFLNLRETPKIAEAGWYGNSWSFRKQITIDHTKVSGTSTLVNFPVLFSKTDTDLKTLANGGGVGKTDGTDILFTSSDGTTKLDHELESYSSTTGVTIAWIRIPSLSYSVDTVLYIYYGNASAADQQNKNGVWDTSYKGVWHLPNGTSLTLNDSTSNANNGTNNGTATAGTGQIDGAMNLNGTTQYMSAADSASLQISGDLTTSVWMKLNSLPGAYTELIRKGPSYYLFISSANQLGMAINDDYGAAQNYTLTTSGVWAYVTATYNNTTKSVKLYYNGNLVDTRTTATTLGSNINPLTIGSSESASQFFPGSLDEARVANAERSSDWIKTEYNNQNSPSTFLILAGSPELPPKGSSNVVSRGTSSVGWYNTSWGYRKQITIDHTKISQTATTTFYSFPFLFSTTDTGLKTTGNGGKVGKSDGTDILFTSADGTTKLDHELESYSSTTGATIAWVRIPTLSAITDTVLYIYYGNAAAADQQNKTGVWDTNYKAVYHMPDGTNLSANDSTTNSNNGTITGATAVVGQVDGSASMDGAGSQYITGGNAASLDMAVDVTVSFWFYLNAAPSTVWHGLLAKRDNAQTNYGFNFNSGTDAFQWFFIPSLDYTNVNSIIVPYGTNFSATTWYHITGVFTTSGSDVIGRLYRNGTLIAGPTTFVGKSLTTTTAPLNLGRSGGSVGEYSNVRLDEIRISNIARSADWITTEYNNQNSPSTFYTLGSLNANIRQNLSGAAVPAIKIRGGVKFH